MASVVDTAVPTGQQGRLRRFRGWRLVLLLASPYLLIQFVHEVAPGLFPDFFSIVGEDQVVPFRDWANRSLLHSWTNWISRYDDNNDNDSDVG